MRPSRIKTRDDLSFPGITKGILRLIPVAPRMLHPDHRLHDPSDLFRRKPADPYQVILHFRLLKGKLLLIRKCLDLTPSALSRKSTGRLYPVGRRLKYLFQSGISIVFLYFSQPYLCRISRQGVLDKKGKALYFSDAFPLCSDIFYRYRVNLIFLKCHFLNPLLLLQYYAPSLFFIAMPLIIRSTCLSSI